MFDRPFDHTLSLLSCNYFLKYYAFLLKRVTEITPVFLRPTFDERYASDMRTSGNETR